MRESERHLVSGDQLAEETNSHHEGGRGSNSNSAPMSPLPHCEQNDTIAEKDALAPLTSQRRLSGELQANGVGQHGARPPLRLDFFIFTITRADLKNEGC